MRLESGSDSENMTESEGELPAELSVEQPVENTSEMIPPGLAEFQDEARRGSRIRQLFSRWRKAGGKSRGGENEGSRKKTKKAQTVVGMSLGWDALRLAKMDWTPEGYRLVEYYTEPVASVLHPGDYEYNQFIKRVLREFCPNSKGVVFYLSLQNANEVLQNLRIPEVPPDQLTNAVYWSFKKDVDIDEDTYIFDYETTSLDEEDENDKRIPVMAYATLREPINTLRDMFLDIGYPLTGITFPFFAARNLFTSGFIPSKGRPVAFFYIDNDSSRIVVYNGNEMPFSRGIKFGVESFVSAIQEQSQEHLSDVAARKVLFSMGFDNPPVNPDEAGYGIEADQIMEMLESTIFRMIRQVERTLHYCSETLHIGSIDAIYVSGELSSCEMLIYSLCEHIDISLFLINPFEYAVESMKMEPPISISERAQYAPPIGVALWDQERTPNLLFTCRDKDRQRRTKRLNHRFLIVFLLITALMAGVFFFQLQWIGTAEKKEAQLKRTLQELGLTISEDDLRIKTSEVVGKSSKLRAYVYRFYPLAILNELTDVTPKEVRLTRIDLKLKPFQDRKQNPAEKTTGPPGTIRIEGCIKGRSSALTSVLASYVAGLENSGVFCQLSSNDEYTDVDADGDTWLFFAMEAELEPASAKTKGGS